MLAQRDYEALLLDLSQGFEGSLDLLADIRLNDLRWDLPVIVLSSQSKPESVESRLQALNVYHWLRKPVDWQQLKRTLNVVAEEKSHLPDVLHVEDDMDVVQVVKSVSEDLAEYGYAGSLAEARYKLGVHNYDVVLLDLTLPDGNGRDLLPIIAPPTRVIVFSGDEMAIPEEGEVIASLVKSQVTNESLMATLSQALQGKDKD